MNRSDQDLTLLMLVFAAAVITAAVIAITIWALVQGWA